MSYLCSPLSYQKHKIQEIKTSLSVLPESMRQFSIATLKPNAFTSSIIFVHNLDAEGVTAVVIDHFLLLKHPTLQSCSSIRDAFLESGWQQLSYLVKDDGICIASYAKRAD